MDYTTRTTCRICGSTDLTPLFSLGEQCVSDFIESPTSPVIRCPIELELCNNCTLVQAKHTARQDFLYSRHYWYKSGMTQTMREALADVANTAEEMVDLNPSDVVLDIGSNDGTLLRSYKKGCLRVGVEPAKNLQEEGSKGVSCLINDFWSYEAYRNVVNYKAKIVTACGMFYDLEDPNQFIADIAKVLMPKGIFIAQLMTLKNMLQMNDVGNLAHEHLEYYSLKSLKYLLGKYGLEIFDIETNSTNGMSDRLYIAHKGEREISPAVAAREASEASFNDPELYRRVFARWEINKQKCVGFIKEVVAAGMRVWVYGASTKGNVILQWYGLDNKLIQTARDASPEKKLRYTVGTNLLITSPSFAIKNQPDYFLVLPYAFRTEILKQEQWFRDQGTRFIFPLPELEVV